MMKRTMDTEKFAAELAVADMLGAEGATTFIADARG